MKRVTAATLLATAIAGFGLTLAAPSLAAPAAARDVRAARRATAESIAAQYAAEQFRAARIGDEATQRLLAENDANRRRIAGILKDAQATAAQRDAALTKLAELDAQLGELNNKLFASEQTGEELRAQVREYQRQITDAVDSASPEVLAAYELYAQGDRDTAYEVIDRLSQIEAAAAKRAGEIRAGALLRRPAYLAMDRRDRGEMTLAQVIGAWERAQAADGAYYSGWVTLTGFYASAGRLPDARAAAERALQVASNDVERGLANAELGQFLADQGDRGGASAAWTTALAQLRAAHAANAADDDATQALILIITRLGAMHASLQNHADAAGFYEEALGLARAQAEAQPINRARQRSLLVVVSKVGEAHQNAENWPAALSAYTVMEGLTRAALADSPGALAFEQEHAIALLKLGDLHRQTGEPARARPLIDEGLATLRRAAAADRSNQSYKRDLAMALIYRARLSGTATPRGQREYLDLVEESVRLRRELVGADPANVVRQRELALGLEIQSRAFVGRADPSPARPLLEEALAIYRRIALAETADGADMRVAVQTLESLAEVVQRTNPAEAGPLWDQALANERLLADSNPTVRVMQVDYAVGLAKAAQRRLDAGDTPGAIDLLQQTLVHLRKAAAIDGTNRATRRMLATTLKDLGDFLYQQRQFDPSTALYREALTEFRRLNKDRPDDPEALRDYWQALKVWADRTDDGIAWASVVRLMEDADARGQLTAPDRRVLADARRQAATRPAPPPRDPTTRRSTAMIKLDRRAVRRLAAPLAAGVTLLSGSMAFIQDLGSFQKLVCKAPGIHGLCGSMGWGGVASQAQDDAWAAAVKRQDGEGLRGYLRRWPRGAYAQEAQARLAGCRTGEVETWANETRRLPMYVGFGAQPKPTEAAARADAIARGARDGQGLCVAFSSGEFQLNGAEPVPKTWRCEGGPGGQACGFEGEVICRIEARRIDVRELCQP